MLEGLKRFSAVVWGFLGLYVFWMLASICFSSSQPAGENIKGAAIVAAAIGIVYGLHRLTCWVLGGSTKSGAA